MFAFDMCGVDGVACRLGDRPLRMDATSDNAYEASSAVSSRTPWVELCAMSTGAAGQNLATKL